MNITKKYKKLPSFICKIEVLLNALTRIQQLISQSSGKINPDYVLVLDGDNLYVMGLSPEVISCLSIKVEPLVPGVCCIPAVELIGILKTRSGTFSIEGTRGQIVLSNVDFEVQEEKASKGDKDSKEGKDKVLGPKVKKVAKKKGTGISLYLDLLELSSDIIDRIELVDFDVSGKKLSSGMQAELKRGVKSTTIFHSQDNEQIPILLRVKNGRVFTASYDHYHGVQYFGLAQHSKSKDFDFDLAISAPMYGSIEKFVSNKTVLIERTDHSLKLMGGGAIYAAIPPVNTELEFTIFDHMERSRTIENVELSFTFNSDFLPALSAMLALNLNSLNLHEPLIFQGTKNGVVVTYKTTVGSVSETFEFEDKKGKGKNKYEFSTTIMANYIKAFAGLDNVTLEINDSRFIFCYESEDFILIGAGMLNES